MHEEMCIQRHWLSRQIINHRVVSLKGQNKVLLGNMVSALSISTVHIGCYEPHPHSIHVLKIMNCLNQWNY